MPAWMHRLYSVILRLSADRGGETPGLHCNVLYCKSIVFRSLLVTFNITSENFRKFTFTLNPSLRDLIIIIIIINVNLYSALSF